MTDEPERPPVPGGQRRVRVAVLGSLRVTVDGISSVGAAAQPRRLALLAILARSGHRGIARDKLLTLLWPDAPEDRGRRILTQAIYALRRDLGVDAAILGTATLSLNPEFVETDLQEFEFALARGQVEQAMQLREGPFLDGFAVPGAEEFERWLDGERRAIEAQFIRAVKREAEQRGGEGDLPGAVALWRRAVTADPFDAESNAGLMRALGAVGDPAAAVRQAEEYSTRLVEELGLPPAPGIVALADKFRNPAPTAVEAPMIGPLTAGTVVPESLPAPRVRSRRLAIIGPILLVLATALMLRGGIFPPPAARQPVLIVGRIADHTDAPDRGRGPAVAELLATDLSIFSTATVVSTARVFELLRATGGGADSTVDAYLRVARAAGATLMVDGAIYSLPDGRFRLDLRRVDPRTGDVLTADAREGIELQAMTDSLSQWIVQDLGVAAAPRGSSTRSLEALRWYHDGMREYSLGEFTRAKEFLGRAVAADSQFAIALYYLGRASRDSIAIASAILSRAAELAVDAPDRDRLVIQAGAAYFNRRAGLRELAETLSVRYPAEPEGHMYLGIVRVQAAEYSEALAPLRTALAMDSLGASRGQAGYYRGEVVGALVFAYAALDSIRPALAVTAEAIVAEPTSRRVWRLRGDVLQAARDRDGALAAYSRLDSLMIGGGQAKVAQARVLMELGEYAAAESTLALVRLSSDRTYRGLADVARVAMLRMQGRWMEALVESRAIRRAAAISDPGFPWIQGHREGQVLEEIGSYREAAALYDSIAVASRSWHGPASPSSATGVTMVFYLGYVAENLAILRDTVRLARLADSADLLLTGASESELRRVRYIRGLLHYARGDLREAEAQFRGALRSPLYGDVRVHLHLARTLMRRGRPREAIRILELTRWQGRTSEEFPLVLPSVLAHLEAAWTQAGDPRRAREARQRLDRIWIRPDPGAVPLPAPPGSDRAQ